MRRPEAKNTRSDYHGLHGVVCAATEDGKRCTRKTRSGRLCDKHKRQSTGRHAGMDQAEMRSRDTLEERGSETLCRLSADSDAYLYRRAGIYTCYACALSAQKLEWTSKDARRLVTHLEEHRNAGHRVPQEVLDRLLAELQRTPA